MKALARAVSKHRRIGVAATGILVAHGSIRITRGHLLMLAQSSLSRFGTIRRTRLNVQSQPLLGAGEDPSSESNQARSSHSSR
jgi:hypothetical protein